jgi:uncharacterized protein (DUF1697 family)
MALAKPVCVFVRNVSIGETGFSMDEFRRALLLMGFLGVESRLPTGYVIATLSDENQDMQRIRRILARGLQEDFGYTSYVLLRDEGDLANICVAANMMLVPEGCRQYVVLCDDRRLMIELSKEYEHLPHALHEQWLLHDRCAFWVIPGRETRRSPFIAGILNGDRYQDNMAMRSIGNIEKAYQHLVAIRCK